MKSKYQNLYNKFLILKKFIQNKKNIKYSDSSSKVKKVFKLLVLTTENFHISNSSLWSSNLSFYSIFSFIPILAIIMSIASLLGFKDLIINSLFNLLPIDSKAYDYILSFTEAITHTKEGIITIVAFISLIWAIIRIFSLIEYSFNAIWKVDSSRNIFRKITDYVSIVFLFPIAIFSSNLISKIIDDKIDYINQKTGIFISLSLNILKFSNFFTMCLLFSIIYVIIPNTKVKFRYALISGIFSTILTVISQKIFFSTQKFLLNYSLVYGSFAILPIFLLWQRFFWSIILLGCHLNFISQNYYKYDYSLNPIKLSFHEKKIISLMIMYILIKNFEDNECEITTEYVAKKLEISINLTQNLIDNLIKIGLINKISVDNKPFFYKPSTSIEKMDIDFITNKLEFFGINNLLDLEENKLKIIYENLNNLIIHNKNTKLKDL